MATTQPQQFKHSNFFFRDERRNRPKMAYSLDSEESAELFTEADRKFAGLDEDDERQVHQAKLSFLAFCALILTIGALYIFISRLIPSTRQSSSFSPSPRAGSEANESHLSGLSIQPVPASIDALVHKNISEIDFILENPCGQTPAEAKTRGCHFDMIEMVWLPTQCYDAELEEEFAAIKDWKLFHNVNRTGVVTWDDAKTGQHDYLLADWDFHTYHCIFRSYKFFRAVAGRGLSSVSSGMAGWHHMKHCRDLSLDRETPLDAVKARFRNGFPDCGVRHW